MLTHWIHTILSCKASWKQRSKHPGRKQKRLGSNVGWHGGTESLIQQNICAGRFPVQITPVTFQRPNLQPCNIYIRWLVKGAACVMALEIYNSVGCSMIPLCSALAAQYITLLTSGSSFCMSSKWIIKHSCKTSHLLTINNLAVLCIVLYLV